MRAIQTRSDSHCVVWFPELQAKRPTNCRLTPLVLVDVREEPFPGRFGRGLRERHGFLHRLVDGLLDDPEIGFAQRTVPEAAIAEERDRVALLLALHLLPRAV